MKKLCIISFLFVIAIKLLANPYEVRRFPDENGDIIVEIEVPGIPVALRNPGPPAQPTRNAVILSDVPALDWCYGCSATSAAMIAGYWDRNGYSNMYAGTTNGGVFPANNSSWGYGECPLSATHQGYDGLSGLGHVNRFWTGSGNSGDDPFGSGNPASTYANCTADYMGTNQDYWNNSDGSTTFYSYNDGSPIYNYSGSENGNPRKRDGARGFRLFLESRGYQVSTNYNQLIQGYNGNSNGYTLNQFRTSINDGIPIMIQIHGHTMVGIGYEPANNTIYIYDTWDHQMHSMQWGGSYSNMQHYMVSVVQLSTPPAFPNITWTPGSIQKSLDLGTSGNEILQIGNTGTALLNYSCEIDRNPGIALSEDFLTTSMPAGWSQQVVSGRTVNWQFRSGGEYGVPGAAQSGAYNAYIWDNYASAKIVRLISPAMDLAGIAQAKLNFWHVQAPYPDTYSELKVYYRNGINGTWSLIESYSEGISNWQNHEIVLPNPTANYYIAFEANFTWGYGIALDNIIVEKEYAPASWLRINNTDSVSGSIAINNSSQLSLSFDASALNAGEYETDLIINSDCPNNPYVTIPVTLNVVEQLLAPENVSISYLENQNRMLISWTRLIPNPGGYKVYYCQEPEFQSNVQLLATLAGTHNSYSHNVPATHKKGFYRVVAFRN